MDEVAASGFAAAADAYQDARPSWPLEAAVAAFDHWQIDPAAGLVVDLAAGTGRLTEQLVRLCPRVLAIEPVAEMRAHIHDTDAVAGTAEQLPLHDHSAQAIFVAEAFHWFDYAAALAEAARVLQRGGGLAIMWNNPLYGDEWDELRGAFKEIVAPHIYHPKGLDLFGRGAREDRTWQSGPGWEAFGPLSHFEFIHEQDTTREGIVTLVGSWSFIAALDAHVRADVLHRVDQLLRDRGIERFRQRWRCELYLTNSL